MTEIDAGWPWGPNQPTRRARLLLALAIGLLWGLWLYVDVVVHHLHHSDFGQVWFAAKELLDGRDPYRLVGPGLEFNWSWPLLYPATAMALVAPLGKLSEGAASGLFIGISTFLLVYGSTRDSWHRLPAFASPAFVIAVSAGQWSPLITAGWFIPAASLAWAAKPTFGLAFFLTPIPPKHRYYAIGGGLVLLAISFLLLPNWPSEWLAVIGRSSSHMKAPILQHGGFLVLLALTRWKRREARLLLAIAVMPQSPSVYDTLPLFLLIPDTYHEAVILALTSAAGFALTLLSPETTEEAFRTARGAIVIATTFLPALVIVLRRPNERSAPLWPMRD